MADRAAGRMAAMVAWDKVVEDTVGTALVVDSIVVVVVVAWVESPADTEVWVAILPLLVVLACLAIVVADTESSIVVAAARADYSVVVAQGSPLVTRLSTFITLGEMRNMREITTVSEK